MKYHEVVENQLKELGCRVSVCKALDPDLVSEVRVRCDPHLSLQRRLQTPEQAFVILLSRKRAAAFALLSARSDLKVTAFHTIVVTSRPSI
jgi:hypothetical protein